MDYANTILKRKKEKSREEDEDEDEDERGIAHEAKELQFSNFDPMGFRECTLKNSQT